MNFFIGTDNEICIYPNLDHCIGFYTDENTLRNQFDNKRYTIVFKMIDKSEITWTYLDEEERDKTLKELLDFIKNH